MDKFNLKSCLAILFATSLIVANITASKVASFPFPFFGDVSIPAGFVAVGVAFLFTDLIGEFYGEDEARTVVNATVLALMMSWVLIYLSILMPAAPFYELNSEFESVLGGGATIITASIITTLISQNIDVSVFHKIKEMTGEGHKWARNILSTSVSQLFDTALFIVLGFALLPHVFGGSITPWSVIPVMIIGQYLAKLCIVALDTPLFYIATRYSDG